MCVSNARCNQAVDEMVGELYAHDEVRLKGLVIWPDVATRFDGAQSIFSTWGLIGFASRPGDRRIVCEIFPAEIKFSKRRIWDRRLWSPAQKPANDDAQCGMNAAMRHYEASLRGDCDPIQRGISSDGRVIRPLLIWLSSW